MPPVYAMHSYSTRLFFDESLEEEQRVPNRFTRVPDRPVPPLPWLGRMVLPLADLFMILMASRPRSGSLRTTWVTPATIVLFFAAVVGGIILAVLVRPVVVGGSRR